MDVEATETDLPTEGAVQTIPKEMLLKVRPPTVEGKVANGFFFFFIVFIDVAFYGPRKLSV